MLSISQRRAVSMRSVFDPAFRARLERDPHGAVTEVVGDALSEDEVVELLAETATRWAFVLPQVEDIEAELPAPTDPRTAVENEIYATLKAEPELIESAARDPKGFVLERLGIEVDGVDLRRETAGTTVIVVPHQAKREELDDELLDMVAGGGNQPTGTIESTGSIKTL